MKFIKIILLSCFCFSSLSYADERFSINKPSGPVEIHYNYWEHGGISDIAKIEFDLNSDVNSPRRIRQIIIKNQTIEDSIEKLLEGNNFVEQKKDADNRDQYCNPDASTYIVISPEDKRDKSFNVSYFIAKGSDDVSKDRTLMVASGKNELLVTVEFSDDSSASSIETLNIEAKMYY